MPTPMPTPPTAPRRPHVLSIHGDDRADDWYWLRDRDDPAVRAYLEAENEYAEAALAPAAALRDRIFAEIRGRIQETDDSAPIPDGPWTYFTRTVEGQQYAIHCRRPARPAPSPGRSTMGGPTRSCSTRTRSRAATTTSRSAASRSRPTTRSSRTRSTSTAASGTTLRFRDLAHRRRPTRPASTTSRTGWRGPTMPARASTSAPTTRCGRTKCGATGSARPRPTTCSCTARTTSGSSSTSAATRSGRFVLVDTSSKLDVGDLVRPDRRTRSRRRARRSRASTSTSTRSSTTSTTTLGDRFLIVTNSDGARGTSGWSPRRSATPAATNWTELVPHRDDVRARLGRRVPRPSRDERTGRRSRPAARDALRRRRAIDRCPPSDPVFSMWIGPNPEYDAAARSATATRRSSRR